MLIHLASKSPRRKEILKKLKIPFRVIDSSYHERMIRGVSPEKLVLQHAAGKVRGAKYPKKARFILGADTLVAYQGKGLGKPRSLQEAVRMLRLLSGKSHYVYTGIALLDLKIRRQYIGFSKTKVVFRKLTDEFIKKYFSQVNPLDKAGAYAIQEGSRIVRRFEGSRTNVIGLPVELLKEMMAVIADSGRVLEPEAGSKILTVEMCS